MRGRDLYRRMDFFLWSRAHRMPRFFIAWWQGRELRNVARAAYNSIPFYRTLWRNRGVDPERIRDIASLERLPIITKQSLLTLLKEQEEMEARAAQPQVMKQTSGSTGAPFSFPSSREEDMTRRFGTRDVRFYISHRYLLWRGVRPSAADTFRIARIVFRGGAGDDISDAFIDPSDCSLHIPGAWVRQRPKDVLMAFAAYSPHFVYSRVSPLIELARFAEERGRGVQFPLAYTHGETQTAAQRDYLKSVFGCEAYNVYGLEEVGEIAVECKFHNGLHSYEESCIIEVLDENNRRVRAGATGRIIVTHFSNNAMPFIRYDTGDIGSMAEERCPCGIGGPRLFVAGRAEPIIVVRRVRYMPIEFRDLLDSFYDRILRFQLVKTAHGNLEIKIIPVSSRGSRELSREIELAMHGRFGWTPAIRIVRDLPYAPSGKNYFFVDQGAE